MAARTGRGNTPIRAVRVSDEVWRLAQSRANTEGRALSAVVVDFLREYGSRTES